MAEPVFVVVMGVSGSGKSTLGAALAAALGCDFLEGDDLHPAENVAAMGRGVPLTDAARQPWLAAIGEWIDVRRAAGRSAVVTCSALRRRYRDTLSVGRPGLRFCHVDVSAAQTQQIGQHGPARRSDHCGTAGADHHPRGVECRARDAARQAGNDLEKLWGRHCAAGSVLMTMAGNTT